MFSGTFDQHVIQAADPFIVVEGEQVSGSFSTLEAAEEFIARQGRYSAFVLRHDGQKWVVAADRPAKLFPHVSPAGSSYAHGIQTPGIAEATLISHIQKTLQRYPHIAYTADAHYLEVPAQTRNGFKVWIRQRSGRSIVGFETWHEEDAASGLIGGLECSPALVGGHLNGDRHVGEDDTVVEGEDRQG